MTQLRTQKHFGTGYNQYTCITAAMCWTDVTVRIPPQQNKDEAGWQGRECHMLGRKADRRIVLWGLHPLVHHSVNSNCSGLFRCGDGSNTPSTFVI